jgi:hypothetical protein
METNGSRDKDFGGLAGSNAGLKSWRRMMLAGTGARGDLSGIGIGEVGTVVSAVTGASSVRGKREGDERFWSMSRRGSPLTFSVRAGVHVHVLVCAFCSAFHLVLSLSFFVVLIFLLVCIFVLVFFLFIVIRRSILLRVLVVLVWTAMRLNISGRTRSDRLD